MKHLSVTVEAKVKTPDRVYDCRSLRLSEFTTIGVYDKRKTFFANLHIYIFFQCLAASFISAVREK